MEERRSEKVSVMLTPATQAKLDAYAARHHWKRSAAASILIEDGLRGEDTEDQQREDNAR